LQLIHIRCFSHTSFVRDTSSSGGSGHYKGKRERDQSFNEDTNIKICVVLDKVPDRHHVPGVTEIVTDEERVKNTVNTETPPWILSSKQKEAAKNGMCEDISQDIDVESIRRQNQVALYNYLDLYHNFLIGEINYFLDDEGEEMEIDSDAEVEDYIVTAQGKSYSVYDITDEIAGIMTEEEYSNYYKTVRKVIHLPPL